MISTQPIGKVELTEQKNRLSIKFPYDPVTLNKVKTLSDRRWHSNDKRWTADLTVVNVEKLKEWGFTLNSEVFRFLTERTKPLPVINLDAVEFRGELYPFQKEGVAHLVSMRGRALLADEMGLGKTVQALAWLDLNKQARPAIVVCPASLKLNWEREAKRWLHGKERITVVSGSAESRGTIAGDIIIINYDILTQKETCPMCRGRKPNDQCATCKGKGKITFLRQDLPRPAAVILDEAHVIKNRNAQRTAATKTLAKQAQHVIALTGTPILNRPVEIFNAVSLVAPGVFPSFLPFAQKYCGARHTRFGWDFTGASNIPELHDLLKRTCMIRRLKSDVMRDLPTKQRSHVPMELDNDTTYRDAEEDFIGWLQSEGETEKAKRASRAKTLSRIEGLKQLAAMGKMKAAVEWIADFLEAGKKLVVFGVHHSVLDAVERAFPGISVRVDGTTSQAKRQQAVDAFQNNPGVLLFIGNIKAAGVGITLTAADSTAFLELPWTPGELSQAEDRVHRIGQESDSVNAYYLVAAGTIEEEVAELLDRKTAVLSRVLDGTDVDEGSMLMDLLKKYGGPIV